MRIKTDRIESIDILRGFVMVLNFLKCFDIYYSVILFQVIWAIGLCFTLFSIQEIHGV